MCVCMHAANLRCCLPTGKGHAYICKLKRRQGAPEGEQWRLVKISSLYDMVEDVLGANKYASFKLHLLGRHRLLLGRVMTLTGDLADKAVPVTVVFFPGVGRRVVTGVDGDAATAQALLHGIGQHLLKMPARIHRRCLVPFNTHPKLDMVVAIGNGTTVSRGSDAAGFLVPVLAALDLALFVGASAEKGGQPLTVVMGGTVAVNEVVVPTCIDQRERVWGVGGRPVRFELVLPVLEDLVRENDDGIRLIAHESMGEVLGHAPTGCELGLIKYAGDLLGTLGIQNAEEAEEDPDASPLVSSFSPQGQRLPLPHDSRQPDVGCFIEAERQVNVFSDG